MRIADVRRETPISIKRMNRIGSRLPQTAVACRDLPILVKICVFSTAVRILRLAARMCGSSSALSPTGRSSRTQSPMPRKSENAVVRGIVRESNVLHSAKTPDEEPCKETN